MRLEVAMTQDIGLAILYLTALAAYLSLAWQIWCAGRWLYRNVYLMHPTYGEADRYARKHLINPLTLEEVEEALHIPQTPSSLRAGLPTTESPITDSNSDAPVVASTAASILASSPLDPPTMDAGPVEWSLTSADPLDVSLAGERTPARTVE